MLPELQQQLVQARQEQDDLNNSYSAEGNDSVEARQVWWKKSDQLYYQINDLTSRINSQIGRAHV